jgi:hypothetical protein
MLPRARPHAFPATRRLTVLTTGLLALHVVLAWLALQAALIFIELAWRSVAGREDYRALLVAHVVQFRTLRAIQQALWLATAVAFIRWAARANGDVSALGTTDLRYSPRTVVTAFLVPGGNLVKPLLVVRELWNAADPRLAAGATWHAAGTPVRVGWWWALLLAALAAEATTRVGAVITGAPLGLGPLMPVLLLGQALTMAAAILGMTVVLGVDRRHEAAAWERAPAAGPPR